MKKIAFITGLSGFAGSHLAEYLQKTGEYEIFGTVFGDGYRAGGIPDDHFIPLNLMDREKTIKTVQDVQPQWVFHLAALSSPAKSFADPRATMTNNIEAEINILDATRQVKAIEKILIVGSAEEYGKVLESDLPIDEDTPLNPLSPYAVSKIAQDFLGLQYFLSYNLPVVRVRPFNHTGERQSEMFVVPAFAKQVAEIEAQKQPPVLKVGNLEAFRDFTDVLDMVRAYVLAMEKGLPGEVYNLGSGREIQIKQVLDELLKLAAITIMVEPDPNRMLPSDVPKLKCDAAKFKTLTGWQAERPFIQTLDRVLNYWRQRTVDGEQ
jgi:GDP-4-dehydro-6-deoxy-D-mannose reductase